MFRLESVNVTKRFGLRIVVRNVSLALSQGESVALIGPNGSGKTTLLLTLLQQYRPDSGTVTFFEQSNKLTTDTNRRHTVLVAPYFQMYHELTAEENLRFFLSVSGCEATGKEISTALERVGLEGRGADILRTYSSGMQQRLKLAHALLKRPKFVFLDEPFVNLDTAGKQIASELIQSWCKEAIVIIATNEADEQALAQRSVSVA